MSFTSETSSNDPGRIRQAAILLLAIGEDQAARAVNRLWPRDVQRLSGAMSTLGLVSARQIDAVVAAFLEAVGGASQQGIGANDYLKTMLEAAPRPARRLWWRRPVGSRGIDGLRWMSAPAIARFVRHQPPQLQAMALAYLDSARAARVIEACPAADRCAVLIDLAALSGAAAARCHMPAHAALGGAQPVAAILCRMPPKICEALLADLQAADAALGGELQRLLADTQAPLVA
ncbi:MAG: hypothetical protein ACNA7W_10420 [Pseudomonadales bacterium]